MTDQAKTATLEFEGKSVDLPILSGSTGPDVIDIRKLYGGTGAFTFDPGFTSTASCESGLTYIDGDAGVLLHRGYPIDQLASKSNFVEVCHLLLLGCVLLVLLFNPPMIVAKLLPLPVALTMPLRLGGGLIILRSI